MSCETKSPQYHNSSSQIPTFGATGNLPSFDKAAHTNNMMNSIPQQNNSQIKRQYFPENCSIENKVTDRPAASILRQDNPSLRSLIEIDLTCERTQLPARNTINNRQQIQSNFPYLNYSNVSGGSNFNDQSILKDATQARYPQDPKSIANGQTYQQQLTQNNHYSNAILTHNQQKLLTTAQNSAHKISPENMPKNLQNGTRNSQIINVPYTNELLQQPKDKYLQTREPHLSGMHAGDVTLKNQNNISQVYKNPQQGSYQFNAYGKETNIFPKPQITENFIQNNNFQGKYNSSQNYYQIKPRELMDPKNENVIINGRQIQPNSITQQAVAHGRPIVLKETLGTSEYHRISQYDYNRMNMNRYIGDNQISNYTQKINPTIDTRQYQNLSTHTLQTAPKPMTTPRPTVISEDSSPWSNQLSHVPRFYEQSNETITERQLQEDIINSVEEVRRNSKYSQYPEAKREIELIKDKLMIETYQDSYSCYSYAQPEYSSTARKRPNEISQSQSLKKQNLSTQNLHLNYQDFSVESPPNTSIQYYKDIPVYDVTHNSLQHQTPKYAPHFNSEMNQIVPTSNSVHSSPRSTRNHDSPGTDLNSMKRRDDEIDRYYCN